MTCPLKTTITIPYRGRFLELLVPCERHAGHLGRCEAPKLQAAAPGQEQKSEAVSQ